MPSHLLKLIEIDAEMLPGPQRIRLKQLNPIHTGLFLAGVVPGGGGGGRFPPPPCNSFVFQVRRLKFCTELLWGSDFDVIFALMSIENYQKQPILKSLLLLYVSLNLTETW